MVEIFFRPVLNFDMSRTFLRLSCSVVIFHVFAPLNLKEPRTGLFKAPLN